MQKRSFLFLQGVASPFFSMLSDALRADGHKIFKINFNGGDTFYNGLRDGEAYRRRREGLAEYFAIKYRDWEISDQIMFGDCRPIHQIASIEGEAAGVRTHVFEEGYFRPYWITLERHGVNGRSLLPKDPGWYRDIGSRLPNPRASAKQFVSSFSKRATYDVLYHLAGVLNPLLYRGYHTHAPVNAVVEYAAYLRRYVFLSSLKARHYFLKPANASFKDQPYYLLPLQLNGDAQIQHYSSFNDMLHMLEQVLLSFARYAPVETKLVIKNHPLDMRLFNYPRLIDNLTQAYDLKDRVTYLEYGDLNELIEKSSGVVTVNSTVGLVALEYGRPVIALGQSIYGMKGLTFQGDLNDFWVMLEKPDSVLFQCFRNVVLHTTQINGGFYTRESIKVGLKQCIESLTREQSLLEELL